MTQEILTHEKIKEKLLTKNYILLQYLGDKWSIANTDEDLKTGYQYILIHKKHRIVLHHWLNGGRIKRFIDYVSNFEDNFIENYSEKNFYSIL